MIVANPLSQTNNFTTTKLDLNGDGVYTGTNEYNDTRTYSDANELKTRSAPAAITLGYNKRGDMIDDGKTPGYKFTYDAFGRLRFITSRAAGAIIEEYTYNALNQRIGQHYDTNASGVTDAADPWINFVMDDKWRIVATVRSTPNTNGVLTPEPNPKELFVYHNAGLGGFGGSSYIDSVILVDQDNTNGLMIGGSAGASDGTLESRRFVMQNWRADVVCTASATGAPLERVRYSAYGVPTLMRVADYNQDGGLDYNDYDAFYADWEEQTGIAADLNLDGVISMADHDLFAADYDTNPTKIGRTHQSAYGVRKGYAGYENDGVITRFSHVRHRVYDNELARWTRRDPIGYVDGMGLYEYVKSNPVKNNDPTGHFVPAIVICLVLGICVTERCAPSNPPRQDSPVDRPPPAPSTPFIRPADTEGRCLNGEVKMRLGSDCLDNMRLPTDMMSSYCVKCQHGTPTREDIRVKPNTWNPSGCSIYQAKCR